MTLLLTLPFRTSMLKSFLELSLTVRHPFGDEGEREWEGDNTKDAEERVKERNGE